MIKRKNIYDFLSSRGFIYQETEHDDLRKLLNEGKTTFYLGIDPTADSLHIGHFFALRIFKFLQEAGHRGIILIGGATSRIGDPSGKSDMRKMLTSSQVDHNVQHIRDLVKNFVLTDGDNPAIFVSNSDWMDGYAYVDFLRDVGVNFNVNTMLQNDCYKNRIKEGGLTFLEMGYMLIQAYDFVHLNEAYGCRLQIGGSDQWANIVAGTALNRKMHGSSADEIYGLTSPLLMTKAGVKMGKTEKGALWVAGDKTSAYDFYQYFYNIEDDSAPMLLRLFTELPLDEIDKLCKSDILAAKRRMAWEITSLIHGEAEANRAMDAAKNLFTNQASLDNVPSCDYKLDKDTSLVDLMVEIGFIPSKSEARRLISSNAISVDDEKISDIAKLITKDFAKSKKSILIKKGKKNFIKVNFN